MKTFYGLVAGLTCLYAWAGCDSSTRARTAGWEVTEEIPSPHSPGEGTATLPPTATAPEDSPAMSAERSVPWPGIEQGIVLHPAEEALAPRMSPLEYSNYEKSSDHRLRLGSLIAADWVAIRNDPNATPSEALHTEVFEQAAAAFRNAKIVYVGIDLEESDGRVHMIQCDHSSRGKIYELPSSYVRCSSAGSIFWKYKFQENDLTANTGKCGSKEAEMPDIVEPWLGRWMAVFTAKEGESPEGIRVRNLSYYPETGEKFSTDAGLIVSRIFGEKTNCYSWDYSAHDRPAPTLHRVESK